MLSWFPTPLDDELLYSILARYFFKRNLLSDAIKHRIIFGNSWASIYWSLAKDLDRLISILPYGHPYTADFFIDNHTTFPFYAPSFPPEYAAAVRQLMKSRTDNVKISLQNRYILPPFLQYCPVCADEEISKYGFPYWHRSHHLSGINVCVVHQVFLEQTEIPASLAKRLFIPAEKGIRLEKQPRFLDIRNDFHHKLYTLAQDAVWLLQQKNLSIGTENLVDRYLPLGAGKSRTLYQIHFISSGRMRAYRKTNLQGLPIVYPNLGLNDFNPDYLIENFRSFYGWEFFDQMVNSHEIGIDLNNNLWRFLVNGRSGVLWHNSVIHLLFMRSLGYSPADVFNNRENSNPT